MIKITDLINESYNPNVYQINCNVAITAGNRPIADVISDIRAVPGVTIVDTIASDYNTEQGRHFVKLSLKIDPSPFNPFDSKSYDKILSDIKKLPDVRGAKYVSNPIIVNESIIQKLIKEVLQEKEDRCKRIADKRYDKPSAYKSGAIVRCRQGKIWKDLKEDKIAEGKQVGILYHYAENWLLEQIIKDNTLLAPVSFTRRQSNWVRDFTNGESIIVVDGNKLSNNYKIRPYQDINPFLADIDDESPSFAGGKNEEYEERVDKNITNLDKYIIKIIILVHNSELESLLKEKNIPYEVKLNEDESLHKWFKRQGPSGKEGGWVDCNTCHNEGGKPKCKACGRKAGEKRSKYPSCRPTPAQCKTKGKGKKWGKTK